MCDRVGDRFRNSDKFGSNASFSLIYKTTCGASFTLVVMLILVAYTVFGLVERIMRPYDWTSMVYETNLVEEGDPLFYPFENNQLMLGAMISGPDGQSVPLDRSFGHFRYSADRAEFWPMVSCSDLTGS